MAKKAKAKSKNGGNRKPWDKDAVKILRTMMRKDPVADIAKRLGRSEGSVRQKAHSLGIGRG